MEARIKVLWNDCGHVRRWGADVYKWSWKNGPGLADVLHQCRMEGYNTMVHADPQLWHKTFFKAYCEVHTLLDKPYAKPYVNNQENYEPSEFDLWARTSARIYFSTRDAAETPWTTNRVQFYDYVHTPVEHVVWAAAAIKAVYDQGKDYFILNHA
jgi:hypothetical protein